MTGAAQAPTSASEPAAGPQTVAKAKPETFGIVIVAVGQNPYYRRLAQNLAATIRAQEPDYPITLIVDSEHGASGLHESNIKRFFTDVKFIYPEYWTERGKFAPVKPKVCAVELTPYDRTLWLDADTLALPTAKPISKLLADVGDSDYTTSHHQVIPLNPDTQASIGWVAVKDLLATHPELTRESLAIEHQTTLLYFRKTPRVLEFFAKVKELYSLFSDLENRPYGIQRWSDSDPNRVNGIPDEAAFNVASALLGMTATPSPYWTIAYSYDRSPLTLQRLQNDRRGTRNMPHTWQDLVRLGFTWVSMPGIKLSGQWIKLYNRIVEETFRNLILAEKAKGVTGPDLNNLADWYRYKNKETELPERRNF